MRMRSIFSLRTRVRSPGTTPWIRKLNPKRWSPRKLSGGKDLSQSRNLLTYPWPQLKKTDLCPPQMHQYLQNVCRQKLYLTLNILSRMRRVMVLLVLLLLLRRNKNQAENLTKKRWSRWTIVEDRLHMAVLILWITLLNREAVRNIYKITIKPERLKYRI